jgi:hypothetical protein
MEIDNYHSARDEYDIGAYADYVVANYVKKPLYGVEGSIILDYYLGLPDSIKQKSDLKNEIIIDGKDSCYLFSLGYFVKTGDGWMHTYEKKKFLVSRTADSTWTVRSADTDSGLDMELTARMLHVDSFSSMHSWEVACNGIRHDSNGYGLSFHSIDGLACNWSYTLPNIFYSSKYVLSPTGGIHVAMTKGNEILDTCDALYNSDYGNIKYHTSKGDYFSTVSSDWGL